MKFLHEQIRKSLDDIIATEELIGDELRGLLQSFIKEKGKVEFSFGILCVLHYEEYTSTFNKDIFKVAAAIELLILSFDIIDDLQDKDTDYIWTKTPALSLNAVLSMMTIASKLIHESSLEHRLQAMQVIEKYTLRSINGQQLDLLNVCRDETSYLQMTEQKSGSLIAMSCLVGTVLANGKESTQVAEYAKSIGVIQQIKNDISDLSEWNGKNDLLNKKYSLPIIYLLLLENDVARKLRIYYNGNRITTSDKYFFEQSLDTSGAIRYALTIKNIYKNKALQILQNTKMNNERIDYLINLMK